MADECEFLTYRQAATLLTVSLSTVIRWTKPGPNGEPVRLTVYEIGPNVSRLKRADVLALAKPRQLATPYDLAAVRVDASAALRAHRDFILADWPEGDKHWRWVATATESEIISWVEAGK